MTHICVSKLTIISFDNDLSPGRRQAIIWTNVGILLIGSLGTNFSEILIEIIKFSFKNMCWHLIVSSLVWQWFLCRLVDGKSLSKQIPHFVIRTPGECWYAFKMTSAKFRPLCIATMGFAKFCGRMMTSSNGYNFPRYWPFVREFTVHRRIRLTKANDAELWCYLVLCLNKWLSKQSRHRWFDTLSCTLWRQNNGFARFQAIPHTRLRAGNQCWLSVLPCDVIGRHMSLFFNSLENVLFQKY